MTSLTRYNPYAVPIQLACQSLRRNFNQIYTRTRPSWRTHLVHGCIALERALFWRRSTRAHGLHYQVSQDFLYIHLSICFSPSQEEEAKIKYIYASNSWASWRSHDICYVYVDPMIYAWVTWEIGPHQMHIMVILTIQLTLLVHIKIASFNSSFPSVVSTITCTTANSIYIMSPCSQP